jgi:Circularly permutated YpsA SLOG family
MSKSPEGSSDEPRILTHVPTLIVSGGQTGADLGALVGAKACGIATGGFAPKGFRTERGPNQNLGTIYGLIALQSEDYADRTEMNVSISDAVILIANQFKSPGTLLTKRLIFKFEKPVFEVHYSVNPRVGANPYLLGDIKSWLDYHKPVTLCFAGNRESKARGIESWTTGLVRSLFGCA